MSASQKSQNEPKEETQKGTNWYLVAGVAAALGVATLATVVVVQDRRKKRHLVLDEHSGFDDEVEWTEDTQYMANFLAITKRTFSHMWSRTVSGVKLIDKSIRSYLEPAATSPLASQAQIEAKQAKMVENDNDDLFVADF